MKKIISVLFLCVLISNIHVKAQDTIPRCIWGIDEDNWTAIWEYLDGDSSFATGFYPSGVIWSPRHYAGQYFVSGDTVYAVQDTNMFCGPDTGVYIYQVDTTNWRDTMIIALVDDNCQGRIDILLGYRQMPCYAHFHPLRNTCWIATSHSGGEDYRLEFEKGDSVFVTGYDSLGSISTPRHHDGWYYNNVDTVRFVSSICGGSSNPGVYTFEYIDGNILFNVVDDSCSYRVNMLTNSHSYWDCKTTSVGIEQQMATAIEAYPNPTSNSLNIKFKTRYAQTSIELYSLEGILVLEHIAVEDPVNLDLSNLSEGLYFLILREDGRIIGHKLVVKI
jgi:hypothetical protein